MYLKNPLFYIFQFKNNHILFEKYVGFVQNPDFEQALILSHERSEVLLILHVLCWKLCIPNCDSQPLTSARVARGNIIFLESLTPLGYRTSFKIPSAKSNNYLY